MKFKYQIEWRKGKKNVCNLRAKSDNLEKMVKTILENVFSQDP